MITTTKAFTELEIQDRVRQGYVDRLSNKLTRMRKMLMDRNWVALQNETGQIIEGSANFGFLALATEAAKTLELLRTKRLSESSTDRETQLALEHFFHSVDQFLAHRPNSH